MATEMPTIHKTFGERRLMLDAIYRALREHQTGVLPRTSVGVGALDLDHSAIFERIENLAGCADD